MQKLSDIYNQYKRYLPAAAFFGGFLWDAATLGTKIQPLDLFIMLAYLAGAAALMVLIGREIKFKGSQYINLVLQFFLGGIFSALVVFYFKSAESFAAFILVFLLAAFLVLNEFLEKHYSKLTLSWALFTFCGVMFLNFSLPHLFSSVHSLWFYLSTLLALAGTYGLRKLCTARQGSFVPSIALCCVLLLMHLGNVIPPVPLVKKNMAFCHHLVKSADSYMVEMEKRPWYKPIPLGTGTFHRRQGEKIFCFSSIFAPSGISTTIYHQWELYDDAENEWKKTDRIGFQIHSGRETGYRGYSFKQNLKDGLWRIQIELENGRVLGRKKIRVETVADDKPVILVKTALE